jgi:hypothetical protein
VITYIAISTRCIYRIAEMADGWGSLIMRNQPSFVILHGIMYVIAVFAMNFTHPSFLFKQSYATIKTERMESEAQVAWETWVERIEFQRSRVIFFISSWFPMRQKTVRQSCFRIVTLILLV